MGSEILGPFFNTLSANHMYCSYNWHKLRQQVQMEWSSKRSRFPAIFIAFSKCTEYLEHFRIKISFIAYICPKLLIPRNVVTRTPLSSCFRTQFGNQRVKGSKTMLKCAPVHFYANVPLISNKLSVVWCLLDESDILEPLFNTLMGAHMYSCHNCQKVAQEVQTQLCSKPSRFSPRFIAFSKST